MRKSSLHIVEYNLEHKESFGPVGRTMKVQDLLLKIDGVVGRLPVHSRVKLGKIENCEPQFRVSSGAIAVNWSFDGQDNVTVIDFIDGRQVTRPQIFEAGVRYDDIAGSQFLIAPLRYYCDANIVIIFDSNGFFPAQDADFFSFTANRSGVIDITRYLSYEPIIECHPDVQFDGYTKMPVVGVPEFIFGANTDIVFKIVKYVPVVEHISVPIPTVLITPVDQQLDYDTQEGVEFYHKTYYYDNYQTMRKLMEYLKPYSGGYLFYFPGDGPGVGARAYRDVIGKGKGYYSFDTSQKMRDLGQSLYNVTIEDKPLKKMKDVIEICMFICCEGYEPINDKVIIYDKKMSFGRAYRRDGDVFSKGFKTALNCNLGKNIFVEPFGGPAYYKKVFAIGDRAKRSAQVTYKAQVVDTVSECAVIYTTEKDCPSIELLTCGKPVYFVDRNVWLNDFREEGNIMIVNRGSMAILVEGRPRVNRHLYAHFRVHNTQGMYILFVNLRIGHKKYWFYMDNGEVLKLYTIIDRMIHNRRLKEFIKPCCIHQKCLNVGRCVDTRHVLYWYDKKNFRSSPQENGVAVGYEDFPDELGHLY